MQPLKPRSFGRPLSDLASRLHRLVAEWVAALSWGTCRGDCHGFNARFEPDGTATLLDFDDGGAGWPDYDLAVFLWNARAFAPTRRIGCLRLITEEGAERRQRAIEQGQGP
jgi:Ser/Thr protein kinase RdoA (MazF antagonist)